MLEAVVDEALNVLTEHENISYPEDYFLVSDKLAQATEALLRIVSVTNQGVSAQINQYFTDKAVVDVDVITSIEGEEVYSSAKLNSLTGQIFDIEDGEFATCDEGSVEFNGRRQSVLKKDGEYYIKNVA